MESGGERYSDALPSVSAQPDSLDESMVTRRWGVDGIGVRGVEGDGERGLARDAVGQGERAGAVGGRRFLRHTAWPRCRWADMALNQGRQPTGPYDMASIKCNPRRRNFIELVTNKWQSFRPFGAHLIELCTCANSEMRRNSVRWDVCCSGQIHRCNSSSCCLPGLPNRSLGP